MSILKVENLKAYYIATLYGIKRSVRAVDNVSLDIEENEIFGIAGESGCGKSTLLKVIVGLIKPPLSLIGGMVLYNSGKDYISPFLLSLEEFNKIRWSFISYIPQGSMNVLNPTRKINRTFWDVIKTHGSEEEKKNLKTITEEHIKALGLPLEVLNSYPHQLSGGMRQRVTMALATILKPKIIVADEPTTALDVVVQRGVLQLLERIQEIYQNTLIIVTHDMAVHANIAHRIAIMYAGKIVEVGKTRDIFKNPKHPYTKYLINSLPKIGDKSIRESAPGAPPSLLNPPSGCRFHPRCPKVMDICKLEVPKLAEIDSGHSVACFLFTKEVEEV